MALGVSYKDKPPLRSFKSSRGVCLDTYSCWVLLVLCTTLKRSLASILDLINSLKKSLTDTNTCCLVAVVGLLSIALDLDD